MTNTLPRTGIARPDNSDSVDVVRDFNRATDRLEAQMSIDLGNFTALPAGDRGMWAYMPAVGVLGQAGYLPPKLYRHNGTRWVNVASETADTLHVGPGSPTGARLGAAAADAGEPVLALRGATGQAASLLQGRRSDEAVLFQFDASGNLDAANMKKSGTSVAVPNLKRGATAIANVSSTSNYARFTKIGPLVHYQARFDTVGDLRGALPDTNPGPWSLDHKGVLTDPWNSNTIGDTFFPGTSDIPTNGQWPLGITFDASTKNWYFSDTFNRYVVDAFGGCWVHVNLTYFVA